MTSILPMFKKLAYYTFLTILLIGFILMLGGIVYDIIEARAGRLETVIPIERGFRFTNPYPGEQTLGESIISILFLMITLIAPYLFVEGIRQLYRPRYALILFTSALMSILASYLGLALLYHTKLS